jgi:hypothetical protein
MKSIILSNILFICCAVVEAQPMIRDYPELEFTVKSQKFLGIEIKHCDKYRNVVMYGYINRHPDPWSPSDFSKNFQVELKSRSCFAYAEINTEKVRKINYLLYFDFLDRTLIKKGSHNLSSTNDLAKRRSRRKLRKSSREIKVQSA